ncbi:c-type cytochrome [Vibrio sp. TRT 17S01]|uniref:c-type cytochrome n=1 Tax=Vibrio sp. TRT 17S01 TaxID=3418505 RepID=UPI003CEBADB2
MKKYFLGVLLLAPLWSQAQNFDSQIEQRQQAFKSIEQQSERVESLLDNHDLQWDEITKASEQLVAHSQSLSGLFPTGSDSNSKAKIEIWQDSEKFHNLLHQMILGFTQLNLGAQNQNQTLSQQGLEAAQKTCRNCHRTYRSRW